METRSKRNGSIGVKKDGRSYGWLPIALMTAAGLKPGDKVEPHYTKPAHRKPGYFFFEKVRDDYRLGIRLKREKAAGHFCYFEVQNKFKLFEKMAIIGNCKVSVKDGLLYLELPKGMIERDIHTKLDPEPEEEPRKRPKWGLSLEAKGTVNDIVLAILRLKLEQRIFDCMAGTTSLRDPRAEWNALLGELNARSATGRPG